MYHEFLSFFIQSTMSQPKYKKNSSPWLQCEKCNSNITTKDVEKHSNDCPPNSEAPTSDYNYIKDAILYGSLDFKSNEDIKGISDKTSLVFLSQAAIQLCGLAIGEWAELRPLNAIPLAKIVWPTNEKTLTSVLLTKQALDLSSHKSGSIISVLKLDQTKVQEACKVMVVLLNRPKAMELTPDLSTRLLKYLQDKIWYEGNVFSVLYFGKLLKIQIKVIESAPSLEESFKKALNLNTYNRQSSYKVTNKTQIEVYTSHREIDDITQKLDLISTIGGLDDVMTEIREVLTLALAGNCENFGLKVSKSMVLYGNQGTGKTLVATALSQESAVNFIKISPSDLYLDASKSPEDLLKEKFKEAEDKAPSIILIDEIDVISPSKSSGRLSDSDRRLSSTLSSLLDDLNRKNRIFVIATTNKIDSLEIGIRRPGRLDSEIEIPTPNSKSRGEILTKLLHNVRHDLNRDGFAEIASKTHGFVGADLLSLTAKAGTLAQRRRDACAVSLGDFLGALKYVRPSAMREVQVEVSNVKWADIGGQNRLKLILKQAVEWPLKHPQSFLRLGITPPKGVLMYGPPGCSKTMIAKALATESGLNFLSIKGPELFSKWVGESEKAVRDVFRKARQVAPSIIFFDEIDALGGERSGNGSTTSVQERVLAQLLTELDGVSPLGDVTVLAATNRPDRIDKALLRPGRLDRIVYVPLPDRATRSEIFRIKLAKMPVSTDLDLDGLVQSTDGYSGAEINAVCHEAAMKALEDDLNASTIDKCHFNEALKIITPRTPKSLIDLYTTYYNS